MFNGLLNTKNELKFLGTENQLQSRKRGCGCASSINISTPKWNYLTNPPSQNSEPKELIFQNMLKETRHERASELFKSMNNFWNVFKSRSKSKIRKNKHQKPLFSHADTFLHKMYEREKNSRKDLSDIQSGLNRWLFSLKKCNDPSRKHYERWKSIGDPNRALWVHVNEVKHNPKIKIAKSISSPVVNETVKDN